LKKPDFEDLAFTFLDMLHNAHFAGVFAFHLGDVVEVNFGGHCNVLLDLLLIRHKGLPVEYFFVTVNKSKANGYPLKRSEERI
jgi:hypothetical protein